MDFNYEQELTETYTRIIEAGGELSKDPGTEGSWTYVITDYDFDRKQQVIDRLKPYVEVCYPWINNPDHEFTASELDDIDYVLNEYSDTPNLVFSYNPESREIEVKRRQPIAEYCEDHSIYYPESRESAHAATSEVSFNVADLETCYYEWIKSSGITTDGFSTQYSDDLSPEQLEYLTAHPLYRTFYDYYSLNGGGDFSLETFIHHIEENGFSIGFGVSAKDFTFDSNTGLLTFDLNNNEYDLYYSDYFKTIIAAEAYKSKVVNDLNNGNQINYKVETSYLIDSLNAYLSLQGSDVTITEDNLEAYLAANGMSVLYGDGNYLYLQTNINSNYDEDLLGFMCLVNNNSNSLYRFDSQQLENKANCYLGVSGMELGETYINSLMFDPNSEEYKTFVATYGDIGKIYTSTYNGFTVHIPQLLENGKYSNAFTNLPASLFELVNSNEQTLDTLGYSLSVRKDSMVEYGPDGYSCEDYKNVVAITDDTGKVIGYKIVLNNNQYEEVYPDGSGKYTLFDPSNDSAVDSVVRRSNAYDCLEVTNALREKYSYADVKYSNGNYYLTVNGEQIVLGEDEVRGPDGLIVSNLDEVVDAKCTTGGSGNNNLTIYNRKIVNKPKCISFDDETNYRGLVTYLKQTFNKLITGIKLEKSGDDDKDIYGKIKMGEVKSKLDEAASKATETGVKVEKSVRVLKTYDADLKSIFDLMVDDIFKLGIVDKNQNLTIKGDNSYDTKKYESQVVDLKFEGTIDEYIDSLITYCQEKRKETDAAYRWALNGLELTQADIDLLNAELGLNLSLTAVEKDLDGDEKPDETRYYLSKDGLETLSALLLRKNGDGFNMESWLNSKAEENPDYSNLANQWDYYNAMLNNTDNIANDLKMYEKIESVAPLAKYAVTEEYEEVLDYVRQNYDTLSKYFSDDLQMLTLEELTLFMMDSKYNKDSDYQKGTYFKYDNIKSNLEYFVELDSNSYAEYTGDGMDGRIFLDSRQGPLGYFLNTYGIDSIPERKAKYEAVKEASRSVENGSLEFWEQGCQDGYFDGLFKYGKNTVDYLYCGIGGIDSPWSETDSKNAYLLELYAGDYTKSEVEQMYRDGLITKEDYEVRMQVLKPENTIKYDFQRVKNVGGFMEALGNATADVVISAIPIVGKTTLAILKATSAAGKVARKLHEQGNSYGETLAVSTLTGIASYFLSTGLKSFKKENGGHLFSGNGTFGNYSTEDLKAFGEALDSEDISKLTEIVGEGDIVDMKRWYSWYKFYNSKFGEYGLDAAKEFLMGGNGVDKLATTLVTTTAYSIWQSLEGESASAYNYEKFFNDDVFATVSMFTDGKVGERAESTGENFVKSGAKDVLTWLLELAKSRFSTS